MRIRRITMAANKNGSSARTPRLQQVRRPADERCIGQACVSLRWLQRSAGYAANRARVRTDEGLSARQRAAAVQRFMHDLRGDLLVDLRCARASSPFEVHACVGFPGGAPYEL